MPEKAANIIDAWEVELAVNRLERLSISVSIASKLLSGLFELNLTPGELTELVESDPAMTVLVFSLAYQKDISFSDEKPSIAAAIGKLDIREIRDEFLSSRIYSLSDRQQQKSAFRKQLVLFSNAVAYCAKEITGLIQSEVEPELAYAAGLLHNIGNLALEETMPRSFERIVEQAKEQKRNICQVQRENLGIDYTILGKRLAVKWHLPEQITLAIWLHQSDTKVMTSEMSEAKIAQIVRLAYLLSRKFNIGDCGCYDVIESPQEIAYTLGIEQEQLEQIHLGLEEKISQKSKLLMQDDLSDYCKNISNAAAHLAKETSKQSQENRRLQTKASYFDFTTEFLTGLNSVSTPIELARVFAVQWQKFYQTGKVCIYLTPTQPKNKIKAVIVENEKQSRIVFLKKPAEIPAIPSQIQDDFAVIGAKDQSEWIFEQIDTNFDIEQTKIIPILSSERPAGAILFEFHYPVETKQLQEMFRATSFIAAVLFNMSFRLDKQQSFAEGFARCIKKAEVIEKPEVTEKRQPQKTSTNDYITALTEMAAGAAHELNNPLSVISGRAQLLFKAEDDPQKREALKQIQENAGQLTKIIEDLMGFAEPASPRKSAISVKQIVEEALQLSSLKTGVEHINTQIVIDDDISDVMVDSAQVVSAIANILSNSIESYADDSGLIKITTVPEKGLIKLQISDFGSGMDEQTTKKAAYPFFSAQPAGRKRGMGLAHAARLIQLNAGSLEISSRINEGTTATITLPANL